jgi:hypothetical protein
MRNYRELFEQEFSGDTGIFDIDGSGLALGVKTLRLDEAMGILFNRKGDEGKEEEDERRGEAFACSRTFIFSREVMVEFVLGEKRRLLDLRGFLMGTVSGTASGAEDFDKMLDDCDYLWAHFPECAGAGGRRQPSSDLSFLKRVRAEIDPFLKLWDMTLREIENIG